MTKLLIVESPTKARTISRMLDSDYNIIASMGHVRDLPEHDFGIDIANKFAPQYVDTPRSRQVVKNLKEAAKKAKKHAKDLAKARKNPKDVLTDAEYKEIKTQFFNAEGYGDMYNCWVEQQRFCKVKDYDTGVYVLCDREVSRTQMESAKIFYKLGRCVKLN